MSHDHRQDVQELPACYRCHASKVRCRRAPGQVRCRRCIRVAYPDCHPRPSRRGRIGQQQMRGASGMSPTQEEPGEDSSNPYQLPAKPGHELHEQAHDIDSEPSHTFMDLSASSMATVEYGDSDLIWSTLFSNFDEGSLQHPANAPPSKPPGAAMSFGIPESVTGLTPSSSQNKTLDGGHGSNEKQECQSVDSNSSRVPSYQDPNQNMALWSRSDHRTDDPRLSSAAYIQALTDLNAQMLSQQDGMLEGIRQFLVAPTRRPHGCPLSGTHDGDSGPRNSGNSAPAHMNEGPVEAALRLGLALRALLRPHQTCDCEMATTILLLSTVLRLASLLHDLLIGVQGILAEGANKNALCAFVFPPVRLGSLLIDEWDDDRLKPLQMHSIAMALGTAEGLVDEVVQLMERLLPDHISDGSDGEANAKEDVGLQALTRVLVAKQEAVVESISGLRDMLCC